MPKLDNQIKYQNFIFLLFFNFMTIYFILVLTPKGCKEARLSRRNEKSKQAKKCVTTHSPTCDRIFFPFPFPTKNSRRNYLPRIAKASCLFQLQIHGAGDTPANFHPSNLQIKNQSFNHPINCSNLTEIQRFHLRLVEKFKSNY